MLRWFVTITRWIIVDIIHSGSGFFESEGFRSDGSRVCVLGIRGKVRSTAGLTSGA